MVVDSTDLLERLYRAFALRRVLVCDVVAAGINGRDSSIAIARCARAFHDDERTVN